MNDQATTTPAVDMEQLLAETKRLCGSIQGLPDDLALSALLSAYANELRRRQKCTLCAAKNVLKLADMLMTLSHAQIAAATSTPAMPDDSAVVASLHVH